ncbi:MAG: polysulfide reductase NrfD [Myxococcales bacterium]|nr:polysulfide reductase NrfD [Myxococcales bacterium]
MNYGFVIDNSACIGCHACSTACKSENQVPLGVHRTWVKVTEVGRYPDARRSFQVTRCNHCSNPPCVRICPVTAMFQRDDGIVDFDSDACIGCKACMQACPYDAIHLDPETHTAAKCHYCAHRVDVGMEPACVVVCPEHAILAGDLDDPTSEASQALAKHNVTVRKPEQGTSPKVFYIEGHEPALTPTAAPVPANFMFADVLDDEHWIGDVGTHPAPVRETVAAEHGAIRVPDPQGRPSAGPLHVGGSMAAHMVQVAYTSRHKVQWHWPIPAYMVTKGISAGVFGLLSVMALWPGVGVTGAIALPSAALAVAMLAITLALLVYDLDRPDRFFYLLVRPQWRSWVARAAWILTGFSVATGLWLGLEIAHSYELLELPMRQIRPWLAGVTLPLAVMSAVYTAFLFAQAEGRDLWQSPALPLQLGLHAVLLGAGALALFGAPSRPFALAVALSLVTTLVADLSIPHASDTARRAAHDLTWGAFSSIYWMGGIVLGHVVPLILLALDAPEAAFGAACVGLFAWSWAFVMAPQRIPNS